MESGPPGIGSSERLRAILGAGGGEKQAWGAPQA